MSAGAAVGYGFLGLFLGALVSTPIVVMAMNEELKSVFYVLFPFTYYSPEIRKEYDEAREKARSLYLASVIPPAVGAVTGTVVGATLKPSNSTAEKKRSLTRKRSKRRRSMRKK